MLLYSIFLFILINFVVSKESTEKPKGPKVTDKVRFFIIFFQKKTLLLFINTLN